MATEMATIVYCGVTTPEGEPMRTQTITTTCDLCGYGGAYTRPEDFTQRDGFDFCRWCMSGPIRETSCGGHTVTVEGEGARQCTCGVVYGAVVLRLRMHGVTLGAMDAVPNLAAATAAIHVQTPDWPKTY